MKIKCRDHQWVDWEGHVVCSECNRVYQTKDDELPHFAPMVCACGVKLMPGKDNGKEPRPSGTLGRTQRASEAKRDQKFSARSCCPECFASAHLIH